MLPLWTAWSHLKRLYTTGADTTLSDRPEHREGERDGTGDTTTTDNNKQRDNAHDAAIEVILVN